MKDYRVLSGLDPGDYPSRKVAVAMSGGVDSSLAAILLREAGFEVIGLTMKLWDYENYGGRSNERGCCDISTIHDAKKVAAEAGIPHYTVDLRGEFETSVVQDFLSAYTSGQTPNPCVICNRDIKWRALQKKARLMGYDLFATGHYARIARHDDSTCSLLTGVDSGKDQSYFLWALESDSLPTTLFPLGAITKEETRRKAKTFNLKTAYRPESQEICFIPDNDYRRFLRHRFNSLVPVSMNEGMIFDRSGKKLGEHEGAAFYTIGQRRGLGISAGHPLYVTAIDAETNSVYVGARDELASSSMLVGQENWLRGFSPGNTFKCTTRIRYRHPGILSEVKLTPDGIIVAFDEPQSAVTPGQSAVFYQEDLVLGGGIIQKTVKS